MKEESHWVGVGASTESKSRAQKLSREEKQALCEKWKVSGLSRSAFCRREGLAIATFCTWCRKHWPESVAVKEPHLRQVTVREPEAQRYVDELLFIEVCFPNEIVARIKVVAPQLGSVLKELVHATTIIR